MKWVIYYAYNRAQTESAATCKYLVTLIKYFTELNNMYVCEDSVTHVGKVSPM